MVITRMHLDRRTFLRGMGTAIALPWLEAMIPAGRALAAGVGGGPRLAFVYVPHGAVMNAWTPAAEGPITTLPPILRPLAPFAERLTVVSGLENRHALGPVHALTPGTWLSGRSPREPIAPGQGGSADQLAAAHLGGDTLLASIEVAAEEPRAIGTGGWDASQWHGLGATISLSEEAAPRAMEVSPRRVFDRLFSVSATSDPATTSRRSVLDRVADDAARLPRRLGPRDRSTLSDYLDNVRDVERQVEHLDAHATASLESTAELEEAFTARQRLMFDLIALAFRADVTRVASFMMAAETSDMTYGHLGVSEAFYQLSHHRYDPGRLDALVRIQHHHTRLLSGFVRTLAESADGDGSILDRTVILYGSNMSDSHAHDHFPLPLAVVGGPQTTGHGMHVRHPDRTPMTRLLVSLLERSGVPAPSFSDRTTT
jgi:hypothetical protein